MKSYDDNGPNHEEKPSLTRAKPIFHALMLGTFIAVFFAADALIRHYSDVWFASVWGYTSLTFAALAIAASAYFFVGSLLKEVTEEAAQFYSADYASQLWHARWAHYLGAISMFGHALIFLACGWIYPNSDCRVWQHFGALTGIGFLMIIATHLVAWRRHKPLMESMIKSWALANVIFFGALLFLIILWAYAGIYVDVIGILLTFAVSSIIAQIWTSIIVYKAKIASNQGENAST